jgi:hypothetical protein
MKLKDPVVKAKKILYAPSAVLSSKLRANEPSKIDVIPVKIAVSDPNKPFRFHKIQHIRLSGFSAAAFLIRR